MKPLTWTQSCALEYLRDCDCPGVLTAGATGVVDGEPWINYRTAYALRDAGLVLITPIDEANAEIRLVEQRRKGTPDA